MTDLKNMSVYHEERTLTEGFRKAKTKTRTTATRLQEPQENPEKRYMLEKGREARRNDSGLKHKTSLLNILFALILFACLYIKRIAQPHSICSLFNSRVSLCFVNGRLSFYYFKILTNFTCKRIRANVGLIYYLCR